MDNRPATATSRTSAGNASPAPPSPAAPINLDLAFSADPDLAPELQQAARAWLDPLAGADPWHSLLSAWLGQLVAELPPLLRAPAYSLGLNLVGDAEIAALNGHWRQQAVPTDVLAFAAQEEGLENVPPPPMPPWDGHQPDDAEADGSPENAPALELGDIVISVETAARQALEHGHGLQRELQVLASHGLLHLLGWDHPNDDALAAMLARQELLIGS